MASTYLTKTFSSAGNRKTWTMSAWIKRTNLASSSDIRVFGWKSGGGNYGFQFDSNAFRFYLCSGGSNAEFLTNRKFRDCTGWYHIVAKCDTTQSTASDRFKIYVNGVQETSFATATYPNQNEDTAVNQAEVCRLGCSTVAVNSHFDGLMSHVHFTDGYAYDASAFGSFDSVTGNWSINTGPSVTYGTNGFFLLKDDNAVTDRSGQGNNFTLGAGTLSKTEDNPSNIFCTMNPLQFPHAGSAPAYENGATRVYGNLNHWHRAYGSIGAKSGKWWYELYIGTQDNSGRIGWDSIDRINNYNTETYYSGLTIQNNTGSVRGGRLGTSAYSPDAVQLPADGGGNATFAQGDYLGMGIDLDNNTITIEKNGNALATNWSFASYNTSVKSSTYGHFVSPSVNWYSSSGNQNIYDFNFGNGKFGSSAALTGTTYTDSAGRGVFKYQPPTNYLAWCTRNLNE